MYDFVIGPAMRKDLKKIKNVDLKEEVAQAISLIRRDPSCGETKTGDLVGFSAYRLSFKGVSYRIGYMFLENKGSVAFSLFDTRENFYARAKRLYAKGQPSEFR